MTDEFLRPFFDYTTFTQRSYNNHREIFCSTHDSIQYTNASILQWPSVY